MGKFRLTDHKNLAFHSLSFLINEINDALLKSSLNQITERVYTTEHKIKAVNSLF